MKCVDLELSMGMTDDYEHAVSNTCNFSKFSACVLYITLTKYGL